MFTIQALAGGDKPRPYARSSCCKVVAGFIPAHKGCPQIEIALIRLYCSEIPCLGIRHSTFIIRNSFFKHPPSTIQHGKPKAPLPAQQHCVAGCKIAGHRFDIRYSLFDIRYSLFQRFFFD
jgi:hypothetical protein